MLTLHRSSWQVVYTCITVLGVTKTSCGTVALAVVCLSDCTLCMLGGQPEMTHGIFWHFTGDTRAHSTSQLLIVRIHTCITVLGVTKPIFVTVAIAVVCLSDYTLCILRVQPEMIQGIFPYVTGDTRADSTSQHEAVGLYTRASQCWELPKQVVEPLHLRWFAYLIAPCVF